MDVWMCGCEGMGKTIPRLVVLRMADPLLLQLLHHSLSEWPALQLAIDQGMGGADARQKQTWMGQVIYDFLLLNKHAVDEDELYYYIADIMDNEFDTIVDDGSMSLLTRRVTHFCKLQLEGNEQELSNILDKKRSEVSIGHQVAAPQVSDPSSPLPEAADAKLAGEETGPATDPQMSSDEDWTLVTRKSNRRI